MANGAVQHLLAVGDRRWRGDERTVVAGDVLQARRQRDQLGVAEVAVHGERTGECVEEIDRLYRVGEQTRMDDLVDGGAEQVLLAQYPGLLGNRGVARVVHRGDAAEMIDPGGEPVAVGREGLRYRDVAPPAGTRYLHHPVEADPRQLLAP